MSGPGKQQPPDRRVRPAQRPTLRGQLLPTCREMSAHSSRALDAPAPLLLRVGMAIHRLFCGLCHRYARQLRWTRAASLRSGAVAPESATPRPADARERLRSRLREAAAGRAPIPTPPPDERRS